MEKFFEILKEFNIQTIISLIAVMWYFTGKFEHNMSVQAKRSDKLYEMYCDEQSKFYNEMKVVHKEIRDQNYEMEKFRKDSNQKFYDLLKEKK